MFDRLSVSESQLFPESFVFQIPPVGLPTINWSSSTNAKEVILPTPGFHPCEFESL